MARPRFKPMSPDQFRAIQEREWREVELKGDAIPEMFRGIPQMLKPRVLASGTLDPAMSYSDSRISSGRLLGGIDVYREAPEDPVLLNKDWYAVVAVSGTDTLFVIERPIPFDEHWINSLPERLHGAEVLGVPSPTLGKGAIEVLCAYWRRLTSCR